MNAIREERAALIKQLHDIESRLRDLQAICNHPETEEGTYSWRIGSYKPAEFCSDCGAVIRLLEVEQQPITAVIVAKSYIFKSTNQG